jgi:nucleotide-binding universal stress UspA family protein
MIVLGKTTNFHHEFDQDNLETTYQIAKDNPRPILVIPSSAQLYDRILVAYDGGLQSARTLQLFLLLRLGKGKVIDIVTVHKDKATAKNIIKSAEAMCKNHAEMYQVHAVKSQKKPAEIILDKSKSFKSDLIVMGAFSQPVKRALFGSNTNFLIEQSHVPLFIHH